jgi:rhamnulokinase
MDAFAATVLIAPACHDTASAIAGIPDSGRDWAYISSGTWSLVGTLAEEVCNGPAAQKGNYTNLGAVGGRICFHKNVNGMWLLSQCIESWAEAGKRWTFPELISAAEVLAAGQRLPENELLDVDDPELLLAGEMIGRINAQRRRRNLTSLQETAGNAPQIADLIFRSLARRYAQVLGDVAAITGKKLSTLYIVGGGSRNLLLNRLTQAATGLNVKCGAVESSTLGNFAVQLAVLQGSLPSNRGADLVEVANWADVLSEQSAAVQPA